MTNQTSPQVYARIGGVLYLIIIVIGAFFEGFVRQRFVVAGDAATTAANIASAESLWRFSIAGGLAYLACAVALALIFYVLLRPVSKNLALLVVLFNSISIGLEAANKLNLLAASYLVGDAEYLKAFEPQQLHALAYLSLRMYDFGFSTSLIFFGCVCLVLGHLIRKSGYLPRILGVLMQIAGVCYVTNSFALLLAPKLGGALFPAIMLPPLVAESGLALWLLVKGVDLSKWNTAHTSTPSIR